MLIIEEKFSHLAELVISAAERYKPESQRKKREITFVRTIQILLTTLTTILLGLKLGNEATSIAFIFSTLATAITVWYNIESNSKEYSYIYKYSINLISLAREINFYMMCTNQMEEEKFEEFSKRFFDLKMEFEKNSVTVTDESLKNDYDSLNKLKK